MSFIDLIAWILVRAGLVLFGFLFAAFLDGLGTKISRRRR